MLFSALIIAPFCIPASLAIGMPKCNNTSSQSTSSQSNNSQSTSSQSTSSQSNNLQTTTLQSTGSQSTTLQSTSLQPIQNSQAKDIQIISKMLPPYDYKKGCVNLSSKTLEILLISFVVATFSLLLGAVIIRILMKWCFVQEDGEIIIISRSSPEYFNPNDIYVNTNDQSSVNKQNTYSNYYETSQNNWYT